MPTLYLVEDSARLRTQIIHAIEEHTALRVVGSSDRASVAVREIRELRPRVLVLDLQLAEGTGWDVLDAVGEIPEHVIVLSNHDAPPFRKAAQERGISHFFSKATEFDGFVSVLATFARPR